MVDDVRLRREPPRFRPVEVVGTEARSAHLIRVTVAGPALTGFDAGLPASSIRLLLPDPGAAEIELPTWTGNEFVRADGRRARIRTLTPLRFDPATSALEMDVVLHGESPLTVWARTAGPGTPVAVSGTGAGYEIDRNASAFVVAGDESALPAIVTLLTALPTAAEVAVVVEVGDASAVIDLPDHPGASVQWRERPADVAPGTALVAGVAAVPTIEGMRVWAAGEAAAVQRIRGHLAAVGVPRTHTSVRGYWKHGRAGT